MKKLKNEELGRLSKEVYKQANKMPVSVMLDNVRSMHNVGAAFRTADSFLIEKIYLGGITATPPHREIHKTALGATETVEWEYRKNLKPTIADLQATGHRVFAVEQTDKSIMLNDFVPNKTKNYYLVFGNEVLGVDDSILEIVDGCIEIPQYGSKHSLNISVSMGIVIWDIISKIKR